jgi:pimeloyl-ACP methyl ester carboxylesterase
MEACGFRERDNPKTLYVFAYDWRKSNYETAGKLANYIDDIRAEHSGDLEVTLVAHSMGGLVSRCYLESGEFGGRPGFGCVRMLITMGTPHRGAPAALLFAAGTKKKLFLSASQVGQLANDPRYPSTYELLPPEGEPFVWPHDESTALAVMNIYDAATAAAVGLSADNLRAAQDFHARIDAAKRPAHVRYFVFYGTRLNTAMNISLKWSGAKLLTAGVHADDAGDGTVPLWSTIPGVQAMPVGQSHMRLFWDGDLRRTLAILLGAPGTLAAPQMVQVVANESVVEPHKPVSVALLFPGGATVIDGSVRWVRVAAPGQAGEPAAPASDAATVRYTGAPVENIGLQMTAPSFAGYYRIEFSDSAGTRSTPDELIVQEPSGKPA